MKTAGNQNNLSLTQISQGHISVQVRVRSGYEKRWQTADGVGGKVGGGGSGEWLLFD